ncbi:MAG: tyrosine-type recombinase/integrase [Pseudomonadota bacterium]
MGTIVERPRKNGGKAFMAKIILKRDGKVIHRETQTFDRRPAAAAWISRREDELSKPGAIERAKQASNDPTLADVIDGYIAESVTALNRSKASTLRIIKASDMAAKRCSHIATTDITEFVKALPWTPQTRMNYVTHLSTIYSLAKPMWGYPLDPAVIKDAKTVLRRMGIISSSKDRDRRPTLDELDRLMSHFEDRQKRSPWAAPMCRLIAFAIFSTRRQDEICRIRWDDLDEENSRVMVRDMKNPGQTAGNDVWCDLPAHALRIIQATPKTDERIFPYNAGTIGAAFTDACMVLGITAEDMPDDERLHFHDLRHEGISWLFETGYNIPHAAAVSGHRTWTSLKRYTQLRQRGDKYAGWKWLDAVTAPVV